MNVVYASAGIDAVNAGPLPHVLRLSPQLLDPDDDAMMARISGSGSSSPSTPSVTETGERTMHCKKVFNDTSTLKDQITPDDAQCIFDLGVSAVAANLPEIRGAMKSVQQ
jgi:hypothetical protein